MESNVSPPPCPVCGSSETGWCLESAEPLRTVRCLAQGCAAITDLHSVDSFLDACRTEQPGEHYLGDSTSTRREDGVVILARDFSDGRRRNAPQPRPVFVIERLAQKLRVLDLCEGTKRRPVFREIYPANITRRAQDVPAPASITSIESIRRAAA